MNQEKIGKFIAKKRKEKQLTQNELAEKLGVTDRSISNWENGKNMPDLSLFKPLCDILEISINELLSGEKIDNKDYANKFEENIINTIDYVDKKNNRNNDVRNLILLFLGILGIFLAQFIIKDKELINYMLVICMVMVVYSFKQLCIKYKIARRILAIILIIICILSFIFM